MKLEEFLESPVIRFPSDQTEKTYLGTIRKRFSEYQKLIEGLDESPIGNQIKLLLKKIEQLCQSLEISVDLYLHGNTHKSYEALKKGALRRI